jgi:phosphate starvation-inducible PhoH-like protein
MTLPTDVVTIPLDSPTQALHLVGSDEANLKLLGKLTGAKLTLRGQDLWVQGTPEQRQFISQWVELLQPLWQQGSAVSIVDAEAAYRSIAQEQVLEQRQAQSHILGRTRKGEQIRPKTPRQFAYIQAMAAHDLVFGIGPAGTGKTYLAVVTAVAALQAGRFERLLLTRPAVEAGEKLGFLPGTLQEKIDPYLRPLYDALFEMLPSDRIPRYVEQGVIEVAPLAYMRGRTLNNAFIILDEAQNTTPEQMKMVLTRLGLNSCMVVTGDLTQTDLGSRSVSGLAVAEKVLQDIEGIAFCYFDQRDVVRHSLVQRIVEAYDRFDRPEAR